MFYKQIGLMGIQWEETGSIDKSHNVGSAINSTSSNVPVMATGINW